MYEQSKGLYTWQIDSDDMVSPHAIRLILKAIEGGPDCITFKELIIWNGVRKEESNFSLKYADWADNQEDIITYARPFLRPLLRQKYVNCFVVRIYVSAKIISFPGT